MLYTAAKVIVHHPQNPDQILLIRRNECYEPAGGRVQVDFTYNTGETLEECARREAFEELGVHVKLERYVGSYHFFWKDERNCHSCCAVFSATIDHVPSSFPANLDIDEPHIEPTWIPLHAWGSEEFPLDERYKGLRDIVTMYQLHYHTSGSPYPTQLSR